MIDQPSNQPHIGWSPDYNSRPKYNPADFQTPAFKVKLKASAEQAQEDQAEVELWNGVATDKYVTQLQSDLQMAKDAYTGLLSKSMLREAELLKRAVKAEIEEARLRTGLELIKLECEAVQPSEIDLFKNLQDWDLYDLVLKTLGQPKTLTERTES